MYELVQRYHGPGSRVYRKSLHEIPLDNFGFAPCITCGHECIVWLREADPSRILLAWRCVHCAVAERGVDPATVMNLEPCPENCPYTNGNPLPN
jgi:hypothetical protein